MKRIAVMPRIDIDICIVTYKTVYRQLHASLFGLAALDLDAWPRIPSSHIRHTLLKALLHTIRQQ
jgi:hypothetical protein